MKTKKVRKKLALKKQTISNFSIEEMGKVYGGATGTSCETTPLICSYPFEAASCYKCTLTCSCNDTCDCP